MRLFLASASPRRRELLSLTDLPFTVEVSEAQEVSAGGPDEIVSRNALMKARAVSARHPEDAVLSADTVVFLPETGCVLGKPADEGDAVRMLRLLSGRENLVYTGVALVGPGFEDVRTEVSHVFFDEMTEAAFDDQCTGANPRYPLISEMKQIYLNNYYGKEAE